MNLTTFQFLYQTLLNGTILLDVSSECCQEVNAIAQCESTDLAKESLQQCIQQLTDPDYVNPNVNDCFFNTSESQKPMTSITGLNVFTCNETTEIQNLAKRKPTSESSSYFENDDIFSQACYAVDDNKNPVFFGDSCTHTKVENCPLPHWWRVDLEQAVLVSYVVIYNRVDVCHCENRLRDFAVQVGRMTQNGTEIYTECYFHAGPPTSPVVNISCSRPVCGRFVRIIKQPSDTLPLTLCEVEVYGTRAICMRENFSTYSLTSGTETETKPSSTCQEVDKVTDQWTHLQTQQVIVTSGGGDDIYSSGTANSAKSYRTEDTKASTTSHEIDKGSVTFQWTHLQTQQVMFASGGTDDMHWSGTETELMTSARDATSASRPTDHTVTTSGLSLPFTPVREVTDSLSINTSTGANNSHTLAMGTDLDHTRTSEMTMEKDDVSTNTQPLDATKMKQAVSSSLISTISTKPARVITRERSTSDDALRGPTQTIYTPIGTAANDDITQEVTMRSLYLQTSRSVDVVTSRSVWPVKGQCRCARNVHRNTSAYYALKMQAEKQAQKLVENLSFNINATSRKLRKRHSISDDRLTAFAVGIIAVMFLILVGIVFIGNDMFNAVKAVKPVVKPEGCTTNP